MPIRERLPEPLLVLLRDYPREAWQAHPNFSGLVQFWLERHVMFRRLTDLLRGDSEAALEARLEDGAQVARLARFGGLLVEQLHAHHQIEDMHYFPALTRLEPRLERGFGLLDGDHQSLDTVLHGFAEAANAVLRAPADAPRHEATGALLHRIAGLEALLGRHLEDEEDLIVPVILKHGPGRLG